MIFHTIYVQPLKTIVALIVLILLVWTIVGAGIKQYKIWRVVNAILTFLSLAAILYTTVIDRTMDGNHTMPFIRTIENIKAQPELIREMVMNAFLFFPLGLCLPYMLSGCLKNDENGRKAVLFTIVSALLLSGCIELIQYLYNFGNAELSDIICNTLGAAIGSVSYILSIRFLRKKHK